MTSSERLSPFVSTQLTTNLSPLEPLYLKFKNGSFDTASWENGIDFDGDGIADWMEIVTIFKKYGWEWAGDWKTFREFPHFQKTFGHKEVDLQKIVTIDKNLIDGCKSPDECYINNEKKHYYLFAIM